MKMWSHTWQVSLSVLSLIHLGSSLTALRPEEDLSVENGSLAVEVDCPYQLAGGDEEGLVIKWYFNDDPHPQYQWIPDESPPTALGMLKDRLDVDYVATEDTLTKHSALYILNPTVELTGTYECAISSFTGDQKSTRHLTVYVPADGLNMTYEVVEDRMTITCDSHGAFPEPRMDLYKSVDGNFDSMLLQEPQVSSEFHEENSTYSVFLTQIFKHSRLDYSNKFLCSLSIPRTDFLLETHIIYEPDPTTTSSTTSTTTLPPPHSVPIKYTEGAGSVANGGQLLLVSICLNLVAMSWSLR